MLTHHVVVLPVSRKLDRWGWALIFGEGRAGAVYSWKGRQLGEKRLYISPELNSQFEKSGGPVESPSAVRHVDELMSSRSEPNGLQVERVDLRIIWVYI